MPVQLRSLSIPGCRMNPFPAFRILCMYFCFFACAASSLYGQSVNALSFDGSSQSYVSIPSSSALTTSQFTVEAWVKIGSSWYYDGIIDKGRQVVNNWWILTTSMAPEVGQAKGVIFGVFTSAGNIEIICPWGDNNWHHVAMSFDGTTLRAYIDGTLTATNSGGVYTPVTSSVRIGSRLETVSWNQPLNGMVDEVRIWDTALSSSTISAWRFKSVTASHPNYASLKTYYKFNEGSGTTTDDASSSNLDGTLVNSPSWIASTAPLDVNILSAGTTWESGTWSFGRVPTSSEDAQVNSGLTVTVNSAAVCNKLTLGNSTNAAASLSVNNTYSLTINGDLLMNPSNLSQTFTLDANQGTLTIAGTPNVSGFGTMNVSVGSGSIYFTNPSGVNWIAGNLKTTAGISSDITFSGPFTLTSGTQYMDGGRWYFNSGFTRAGGTLTSTGNAEQIYLAGNLTATASTSFDAASVVTFTDTATITPAAAISFGSITVTDTSLVNCSGNISFSDTLLINGIFNPSASAVISGAGKLAGTGTAKVTSTSALGGANSQLQQQYPVAGYPTIGVPIPYSSLTIDYAGTNQALAYINYAYGKLKISGSITNSQSSVYVQNEFNVSGTYTPTSSAPMYISGTIVNTGTMEFLYLSINGTVTTSSSFTVKDDMVRNGGTFTATGGTVTLTGAWRMLYVSNAFTFYNLRISGMNANAYESDIAITGTLTVDSGVSFVSANSSDITFTGTNWSIVNNGYLQFGDLIIAGTPATQPTASFSFAGQLTVNPGVTLAPTAGTISTSGTSWRMVRNGTLTFKNFTVTNSPLTQPSTTFSVSGVLSVTGGTFSPTAIVTMNSGSSISNSSTLTFTGLTIAAGANVGITGTISLSGPLTLQSSAQLTGSVTFTGTGWTITNSGTINFANLTIAGTPSTQPSVSFSVAGTLTVNSSVTFAPASGNTITMTGSSWGISNSGTLTFRGLTINGTPSVQPSSAFGMNGALNVVSSNFSPTGTVTLNSNSSVSNSGGTLTFINLSIAAFATGVTMSGFTIPAGGIFTVNNSASVTLSGGTFTGGSTFTVGTSAAVLGSPATTVSMNLTSAGLTVSNSGTMTFANLTVSGSGVYTLTVPGTVTLQGTLTTSGPSVSIAALTMNNGATTSGSSTGSVTAGSLTVANSASVSLGGIVTVTGALTTGSSSVMTAGGNVTIGGALTIGSSSAWNHGFGTVTFNGSSATFTNNGSCTFYNAVLNKTPGQTLTLADTMKVSNVLTLTSGRIATGTDIVDITGNAAANVVATDGIIDGKIRRAVANNASTYLFNDAATSVTRASGTNPTSVSIESKPNTSIPYGVTSYAAKRYYTITPTGGSGTWNLSLSYRNAAGGGDVDERNGLTESAFKLYKGDGSSWSNVSSTRSSVTNPANSGKVAGTVSSFSDWTISSGFPSSVTTNAATNITASAATFNGSVNANGFSTAARFVFGTSPGTYTDSVTAVESPVTGTSATTISAVKSSLLPNTTYYFRAAGSSSEAYVRGSEQNFTTLEIAPTVTTAAATNVTDSSFTMNGTVNANNSTTTNRFVYGVSSGTYTDSAAAAPGTASGLSTTNVSLGITGLVPNRIYYFRTAGTSGGGYSRGSEQQITTTAVVAVVSTTPAANIGDTNAVLNGTVNAKNSSTVVRFLYGTVAGTYSDSVVASQSPLLGYADSAVTASISGLAGSTTYYFRVTATNGVGYSRGSEQNFTTEAPLPVELVSFIATSKRLNAELRWKTSMEVNNFGFEVQRSEIGKHISSGSGHSERSEESGAWSKIGFVEGSGTNNSPKEYFFTDKNLTAGTYVYRLKQIDRDGKFSYTEETEIEVGAVPNVFALEQNYPNPFNPVTTIGFTIPADGKATLKIYNTLGQEVATLFDGVAEAGKYHQVQFNGQRNATGIYIARLQSGNHLQVKKMMLLK